MADTKISALPASTTPLAGTEVLPVVQSGTTKQVSVADLTAGRAVSALSLSLTNALTVANGGTGATTITSGYFVQGNGSSAFSGSTKLYTDGTYMYSDTSYRAQVQSGATNNTAPTAITISNKTTGAEAAGLGAALEFSYYGSGGGYSGGKIAGVSLADPFTADMVFYPRNYGYAEAFRIKSTGDVSAVNNLIFSTAAKGINFTANTPAAGMTSQLLNWYEEGTFTPTAASETGSITAYTSQGTYVRVGKMVTVRVAVKITTPGTAGGQLTIANLPFTSYNYSDGYRASTFLVREDENSGVAYQGFISRNSTSSVVTTMTNGAVSWTANNAYVFEATYRCA